MSTNSTPPAPFGKGLCPTPFLQANLFPTTGGYVEGRFCSTTLGIECCLPCPPTELFYPDNFTTITYAVDWINVAGLICSVSLILSFAFLPVEKTHRHYLSICLAIATVLMQLGFIIPLGAKPDQCFNEITPNDMHSSLICAFSGAFLLAGGWCCVIWVFLRALALHLQICWQMNIGKTFMWAAMAAGWGIPSIALTLSMVFTGVSFRFGDTCHLNHKNSLADFWIPLLVFAGATVVIQFGTFAYCIKVYLASLGDDSTTTNSSGALPSYTNSIRTTITPKQAYRRIRRVIELQWRGIAVVLLIIADVIFFAIVFVFMDDVETNLLRHPSKAQDWITCLITAKGDKHKCMASADALVVNEQTITAVLLLLSLNGFWALIFLGRFSMIRGWYELIRKRIRPKHEFVSADVRAMDPRSYEMLDKEQDMSKSPRPTLFLPAETPMTPPTTKSGRTTPDYFAREVRYASPTRETIASSKKGWKEKWEPGRKANPTVGFTGLEGKKVDPLKMNNIV